MKICITLVLFVIALLAGCEQVKKVMPKPTIEVQRIETVESTGVSVYFYNFWRDQNGSHFYIRLNNPQEIKEFRETVEFLAAQLDEADKRMGVHEPEAKEAKK